MSIFAARLRLVTLLCLSAVTAAAGTARHGDSTITFDDSVDLRGKNIDTLPRPVGGIGTLMAKLYYPPQLRRQPYIVHGSAMVFYTIEADGRVADITFSPRMHPDLELVVIKAIRSCQWMPALKHNVPVRCKIRMPVSFNTYKKMRTGSLIPGDNFC